MIFFCIYKIFFNICSYLILKIYKHEDNLHPNITDID